MKLRVLVLLIFAAGALSSCWVWPQPTPTSAPALPTQVDVQATVAASVIGTIVAQQTITAPIVPSVPTQEQIPTPTSMPESEPETGPTATLESIPLATVNPPPTAMYVPAQVGWTRYTLPEEGFAISLPPGWAKTDPDATVLTNLIAIFTQQIIELEDVFSPEKVEEVIAYGIKFFGMDYRPQPSPDLIPGKVYVVKADTVITIPVDMYINTALKMIEQVITPQTTIAYRSVDLANTQATEYKYEMKVPDLDGEFIVRQVVQYVVVDGSTVYVISMHCPAETAPTYLPEFEQIAKTFELIE